MWIIMEMIYIYIYVKWTFSSRKISTRRGTFGDVSDGKYFYTRNVLAGCKQVLLRKKKSTPHHFCEHTTLKEIVSSNWHSHCAAQQQLYWKISELQMLMQHTMIWINDILMWGEKKCMNDDSEKLWKKPQTCLAKAGYSSSPQSSELL